MKFTSVVLMLLASMFLGSPSASHAEMATDCSAVVMHGETEIPPDLAAILSYDCAAKQFEETPIGASARALDMGYPSLMLEYAANKDEARSVFLGAVGQGDRGFFANDPEILGLLVANAENDLRAFVQTLFEPAQALEYEKHRHESLAALPLWENPDNQTLLIAACKNTACPTQPTICPSNFGLTDKLALASGALSTENAVGLCEISPEWIIALRKAGVVDSNCSSTLQVNDAMQNPATLLGPCIAPDRQLADYSALSSSDYPRYLRMMAAHDLLQDIDQSSTEILSFHYPTIAEFLSKIVE